MIDKLKQFVRARPAIFDRVFPVYTRLNLQRREMWKKLAYGAHMQSVEDASAELERAIDAGEAVAVGKIGTSELIALQYHEAGRALDANLHREMFMLSGFFPFQREPVTRFQELFKAVLGDMTHIAVWGNIGEASMIRKFGPQATLIDRKTLEPHKIPHPWTRALADKKVVVVSPFCRSVEAQYRKRREVWASHPDVLPDFDLRTVRSPFSPGLVAPEEKDWFERLDRLWDDIQAHEFDVCLIGAGGLSLPLATRCAALGKVGIHMGGYTQIHFGIWGRRWNNDRTLTAIRNASWCSPLPEETPKKSHLQDNNSYW